MGEKVGARVVNVIQRAGGSFSGRVGGGSGSEEVAQVETGRRVEEEEFSRRNGFGPGASGEDWGGEDEDGDEDDEWREVAGGDSWDLGGGGDVDESYEGEDWGLESLGTKCVTAFDCV